MTSPPNFLIIDHNPDSRFLLVKTLLRKFPESGLNECADADTAVEILRREPIDAIVSHRTIEVDGITLIRTLRAIKPEVPIVMVSSVDRTTAALEAGASRFLNYDEWLRIGSLVEVLLHSGAAGAAPTPA